MSQFIMMTGRPPAAAAAIDSVTVSGPRGDRAHRDGGSCRRLWPGHSDWQPETHDAADRVSSHH